MHEFSNSPVSQFSPVLRRELALLFPTLMVVGTTRGDLRLSAAVDAVSAEGHTMRLTPEALVRALRRLYRQVVPATLVSDAPRQQRSFDQFVEECVVAFVNERDGDQCLALSPFTRSAMRKEREHQS